MRYLKITDSSNIEAVGYDPTTKTLDVVFQTSPEYVYSYKDVPQEKFVKFVSAPSAGVFFSKDIKKWHEFVKTKNTEKAAPLMVDAGKMFQVGASLRLAMDVAKTALTLAEQNGAPHDEVEKLHTILVKMAK